MRLVNKTALITGAASGFGAGIAEKFVAEGARVMVLDRDATGAQSTAAALGVDAHWVHADVTDTASLRNAVKLTLDAFGHIDILVNNAGIGHTPQPLDALDETTFDALVAVNMKAVYLTAQYIVGRMRAHGGGVILNIASTAGVSPRPGLTWYNASKGWLITATKSMAVELAADNIRVNALNPVAGETPLLKTFLGEDTPDNRARFLATIPLGRFSTPEDLGNAACFLCSDEASMITGVAMEVDGGRCV